MLKVGLTGGIACGKSNVLRRFGRLGAQTIDADQVAHQVIEPGKPAYHEIVRRFGDEILKSGGTIDRGKLGRIVFDDPEAREALNRIVHPYVFEEEERLIREAEYARRSSLVIVDAALMIETGSYRRFQVIIVVYCHPLIQMRRLLHRNRLSEEEARKRIDSQMPLLEKIRYAHYIIENSGKMSETEDQIKHTFMDLMQRVD